MKRKARLSETPSFEFPMSLNPNPKVFLESGLPTDNGRFFSEATLETKRDGRYSAEDASTFCVTDRKTNTMRPLAVLSILLSSSVTLGSG